MLKVHFFLRDSEKNNQPDKSLAIYFQLELPHLDRSVPKSTGLKVPHRFWWNYKKHKLREPLINKHTGEIYYIMPDYFEAELINARLIEIRKCLTVLSDSIQGIEEELSYSAILERYDPKTRKEKKEKKKETPTFLRVLDEMIEHKTRTKAEGTIRNYNARKKNITDFLKARFSTEILITEVKYKHIEQLLEWMEEQTDEAGRKMFGLDHRNKHATCLKSVLEFAVNREYLTHVPVARLHLVGSEIKPPKYLQPEARKIIKNCDAKTLQDVKRVAEFLWCTGFSYVDYLALKPEHLQNGCFKKQREKSSIYALPPLLPDAEKIIRHYGGIEKMPKLHINDFNQALKFLGDYCKIDSSTVGFDLTSSVLRETYASMMENEFMFPRAMIKFLMGHKTEKQMVNYSTVMPQRILHELQVLSVSAKTPLLSEYSKFIETLKAG